MALGGQIVYFRRPHLLDDPDQAGAVGEIAIMELEVNIRLVTGITPSLSSLNRRADRDSLTLNTDPSARLITIPVPRSLMAACEVVERSRRVTR